MSSEQNKDSWDREAFIRNRCWVGYLSPFTAIVPSNEEPLTVDLEEINSNTYDYGRLCAIVHSMEYNHADNLKMLICRDGAVAIPITKEHSNKEDVVDFYNALFCKLVIGGRLCEAVDTRDIVGGGLLGTYAIWPVDVGQSSSSSLHFRLRMGMAGNLDSIILAKPRHIRLDDFIRRVQIGQRVLDRITNLTPTFLIRGITELTYRNWSSALSNLWITAEQLTDFIWHNLYVGSRDFPIESLPARTKSMHEDNRTWSIGVKQELLYSAGFLSKAEYAMLYPARQARNKLVHEGKRVTESVALDLAEVISALLTKASGETDLLVSRKAITSTWIHKKSEVAPIENGYDKWREVTVSGL